jgi:hypothetical protein
MTDLTWIGGGNNLVDNPNDWSPTGVPQAGDTLNMASGVMNVDGYTLPSGDALVVNGQSQINISNGSSFIVANYVSGTTVNISGTDHVVIGSEGRDNNTIVNLAKNAHWIGHIDIATTVDSMFINGPSSATFEDDYPFGSLAQNTTFGVNVTGTGRFSIGSSSGSTTFERAVGSGLVVDDVGGKVVIDAPKQFGALANFVGGELDLNGLAKADSYTFQSDMLSIYSGKKIIDTLKLTDSTQFGIEVDKTATGVRLLPYADASHTPVGTPLLMHT